MAHPDTLPAFVRVRDHGGPSAAARALRVSAAVAPRRLHARETQLGARLMHGAAGKSAPSEPVALVAPCPHRAHHGPEARRLIDFTADRPERAPAPNGPSTGAGG